MNTAAHLLTDDLLLVVGALARPAASLPACSRQIQLALTGSATGLGSSDSKHHIFKARSFLARAWRNRILLTGHDGGSADHQVSGALDWYTIQLNRQNKGPPVQHLVGSHLLFVLRTRLPRDPASTGGEYANGLAPSGRPVPEDQLLSDDYALEYLFSRSGGPLLTRAAPPICLAKEFGGARHRTGILSRRYLSYNPTAPGPSWWRPFPDLFCVVIFLLRGGHLDLLDFALRRILAHAPDCLLAESHPIKHWSLLRLDNRHSNRAYFIVMTHNFNWSTSPAASITFPMFLATLALLEYSLPALDVVTSLFNIAPGALLAIANPRIALPDPPFTLLLLQELAFHPDAHRLIPLIQWFSSNHSPLSTTPIARYTESVDVFVSLLIQVDLPQIEADFEASGDAERRQLQLDKVGQAIVELIIKNKLGVCQVGPLLGLDLERGGLVTWQGWAKLLVFGHGDAGLQWVEVAKAAIAKQSGVPLVQVLLHGIEIELRTSTPRRGTVQALFDRGAVAGLSVMDILFHDVDGWDLLALMGLFRIDQFSSTSAWFTPAQLCIALDKILVLDPKRQLTPNTLHIMIHLISKVYAVCLRRAAQPPTQHPPGWLASMSRAHIALLFACVWSVQPSCQPRRRLLFSHSAEDFIDLISHVWREQQRRDPSLSAWHTCLPRFVADHVRERIQYETRADVYYRADEQDQASCQLQMAQLLDMDRKWLVQVLQFEDVDCAFNDDGEVAVSVVL